MTTDRPPDDDDPTERDATSPEKVDRLASEWREAGRSFAVVTVVRREPPVSVNVGDRALVTPDGELVGWVGGAACAQSVAVREAKRALRTGKSALLGLAPDPDTVARPGLDAFPMTCHSGGVLELFVEPVMPTPRLVVIGDSPMARALTRLASDMSYVVTVVADSDAAPRADETITPDDEGVVERIEGAEAIVVATMGAFDESGIEIGLRAGVPYVGLVASRRRAKNLFEDVAERLGVDAEDVVDAVVVPAGLDLRAETPEEIALSILAELVAARRGATDRPPVPSEGIETRTERDEAANDGEEANADADENEGVDENEDVGEDEGADADANAKNGETVIDPVCGMDVVTDEAATVDLDGETYYFCGQGCADAFEDDPERFRMEEQLR